jgi:hypothetical protein
MQVMRRVVWALALCVFAPCAAYAQASIAGLVRDTSGAILPGVTVEAASPVLIEKVRTVTTDGAGQYRIIDLRPGTYSVTFTLPGFNTVKRDEVEVSGTAVITVNADMRVGAVEETVTVTGAAPVVDVQSVRQQAVLNREVIRDIPTSRQYYSVAALVPGMVVSNQTQDVGGSATISTPDYVIHGGRLGDGRLTVDGMSVGSARSSGANRSMYVVNVGLAQETTVSTSGGLGEAETSGVALNVVPREGGNSFRGSFFTGYANSAMQGQNFDDNLRAQGLASPNELKSVWEVTPVFGGPIIKDKLWFLTSARHQGTRNWIAGMYYNKNAGDPTKWTYEPDTTRRALDDGTWKSAAIRLTYQASTKNKINVFWDEQDRKVGWIGGGTSTTSPDAYQLMFGHPDRVAQVTWSSPRTNKLLLEAGTSAHQLQWSGKERPGYNRDMIRVVEQAGIIPGLAYRGMTWASNWSGTYPVRGSVSYVTGSHSSKIGFLHTKYTTDDRAADPQGISYRFNNGVPNQLTLSGAPRRILEQHSTLGIFAQDSWVISRLTLQGGIRYDRMGQTFPEQVVGYTRFIPNGFIVPESEGVRWNDITPRMSAAYSLTGDGKTAVKVSLGKYVDAQDGGGTFGVNLNPTARLPVNTVTRAWNDANRNFSPDCDLLNPVANGECGADSNLNFGKNIYTNFYDDALIHGWGVRPYNWEFSASVQREILPKVGINVAYFRRWFGNFVVTDNRALAASDFDTFGVTIPSDPKLPDGGGYTVNGFVNVNPAKFGLEDNLVTTVNNYGKWIEHWNGIDVNITARGFKGVNLSGGISTGRTSVNQCEILAKLPEMQQSLASFNVTNSSLAPLDYCDRQEPFLLQAKGLGTYVVPKLDVLISGTLQSNPGPQLAANFNASNALIAPSLGRSLAGNAANVTLNVVKPGDLYGQRTNQLDLRFAKILRFGGSRTNIGIDLYNALNANPITAYNQTYGARYLTPTSIMPARFLKFSAQIDW